MLNLTRQYPVIWVRVLQGWCHLEETLGPWECFRIGPWDWAWENVLREALSVCVGCSWFGSSSVSQVYVGVMQDPGRGGLALVQGKGCWRLMVAPHRSGHGQGDSMVPLLHIDKTYVSLPKFLMKLWTEAGGKGVYSEPSILSPIYSERKPSQTTRTNVAASHTIELCVPCLYWQQNRRFSNLVPSETLDQAVQGRRNLLPDTFCTRRGSSFIVDANM